MKVKIGFLGSCATRDIFRTPHNVKYSDDFEILFQQQRVTLISLMQNPVPYTIESTRRIENGEEKVFCSEWIRDDLSKSLFEKLREGIDYLLIDVFFDVLFGVIIYDNTIITNNIWDSPYTEFYSNIDNKELMNLCNNHDKYFELWKLNCDKFFEYMKKEFPKTKVVLNKIRGATKVVRKDGSSYISPSYLKRTEKLNTGLEELENYIINKHDVKVIDCLDYTIADETHIWGRYYVHYIKDYYNLAFRQMKDIVNQDKINNLEKLTSKLSFMSKEIELLSVENKNLLQKNEHLIKEFKKTNEKTGYDNSSNTPNSLRNTQVGTSKVSIPSGYKIHNKGVNGVLFSNTKTYIGIYEVPKGGSFDNKFKEWEERYGNIIKAKTYKDNIMLESVTIKNENLKETYFEKNGKKYHIYEKGDFDKIAFDTLFNSIMFDSEFFYNSILNKINKIPQLSCTSFGYSTEDGKIKYHNWRSSFIQRTLMDDIKGYCENIWFTRFIKHKFPNEDFKLNFIGPFEEHYTLKYPMDGKKIFYSGENLHKYFPEMKEKFNTYALDYVDLSMGYDLIDNEKYLRFPFWVWYHFPPEVTEDEIENTIDDWNSLNYKKTRDVVNISSHDEWNIRSTISNDIKKIVKITYGGKWRNNTRDLWDLYGNNKKEFMKQFKFNICPENTINNGYVTEKIFDSIVSDCIPLYAGGGNYLEPKVLNHNSILRWFIGDNVDNTDTIELFNNIYSDEKTYNEFKDQDKLLDSSKKYIIKLFSDLEKHFERLIYE